MNRAPFVAAGALTAASVLWTARLVIDGGPLVTGPAALVATDLVVLSLIAGAGVLLVHARWARRLGWVIGAAHLALAVSLAPGNSWAIWWAATVMSLLSLATLSGPWLGGWIRRLPAASGPPPKAVILALGLIAFPGVIGLLNPAGLSVVDWGVAGASLIVAWLYARATPLGLWGARLAPVWSALVFVSGFEVGSAWLTVSCSVALAGLAWTDEARLAVMPLVPRRVTPVIIPRELVPPLTPLRHRRDDAS